MNLWNRLSIRIAPLLFCADRFERQEITMRAASLAFSSILCAAPLLALLLGLASAFPEAAAATLSLSASMSAGILPAALNSVALNLTEFAQNARHLSSASLVLALVSGASLSMQTEASLAAAWGHPVPDPSFSLALARAARHWIALTSLPVALAISGVVFTQLALPAWVSFFIAPAVVWAALFSLELALPIHRPPLRLCARASFISTALCFALQSAFSWVWTQASSYGVIYGAAAAAIGALLWIWLFWLSVLAPTSLVASLDAWDARNPLPAPDLHYNATQGAVSAGPPLAQELPMDTEELISIQAQIDDATAMALVDQFCEQLSPGSAVAYQEALAARLTEGADPIAARQSALFVACVHEGAVRALSAAVAKAPKAPAA